VAKANKQAELELMEKISPMSRFFSQFDGGASAVELSVYVIE